ncbi:24174_t:CDS:2 [Dentiscutata erythropus]|uniref:24174_t:CDS:1 n=1 Tax=Dentiscutata erythropus TaxID=1348616 RepID=A0A9N8ZWI8_9GLOM|nr:24174_t:CDS:2 [Dentiscutata erythropus]
MNPILLKSLNVIVCLLLIGATIFTLLTTESFPSSSDINNATNAQNSTSSYTYLTPATYTFGILFVLYFWLVIFVIYQWFVDEIDYSIVVEGFFENLLIRKLFSIWAACSLYALFLDFWIAIPALDTVLLSVIALIILIIIGLFVVDYYPNHDFIFSLVIVWILIGVAIYSINVFPVFTVIVLGIGLITGGIFKSIFNMFYEQHKSMNILD